jgi:ATP synthase protein I
MDKKDRDFWKSMYTMATVGLNMVVATFIGLGLGWVIDNKLFHGRTAPWFTLVFLLFGIIAGFKNVFMMTKGKLDRIEDDNDEPKGDFRDRDDKDKDK